MQSPSFIAQSIREGAPSEGPASLYHLEPQWVAEDFADASFHMYRQLTDTKRTGKGRHAPSKNAFETMLEHYAVNHEAQRLANIDGDRLCAALLRSAADSAAAANDGDAMQMLQLLLGPLDQLGDTHTTTAAASSSSIAEDSHNHPILPWIVSQARHVLNAHFSGSSGGGAAPFESFIGRNTPTAAGSDRHSGAGFSVSFVTDDSFVAALPLRRNANVANTSEDESSSPSSPSKQGNADANTSLFFRGWRCRRAGEAFVASIGALSQARSELLFPNGVAGSSGSVATEGGNPIGTLAVPIAIGLTFRGRYFSVMLMPPLISSAPIRLAVAGSQGESAVSMLSHCHRMLLLSMGAAGCEADDEGLGLGSHLSYYYGADGRYYVLPADLMVFGHSAASRDTISRIDSVTEAIADFEQKKENMVSTNTSSTNVHALVCVVDALVGFLLKQHTEESPLPVATLKRVVCAHLGSGGAGALSQCLPMLRHVAIRRVAFVVKKKRTNVSESSSDDDVVISQKILASILAAIDTAIVAFALKAIITNTIEDWHASRRAVGDSVRKTSIGSTSVHFAEPSSLLATLSTLLDPLLLSHSSPAIDDERRDEMLKLFVDSSVHPTLRLLFGDDAADLLLADDNMINNEAIRVEDRSSPYFSAFALLRSKTNSLLIATLREQFDIMVMLPTLAGDASKVDQPTPTTRLRFANETECLPAADGAINVDIGCRRSIGTHLSNAAIAAGQTSESVAIYNIGDRSQQWLKLLETANASFNAAVETRRQGGKESPVISSLLLSTVAACEVCERQALFHLGRSVSNGFGGFDLHESLKIVKASCAARRASLLSLSPTAFSPLLILMPLTISAFDPNVSESAATLFSLIAANTAELKQKDVFMKMLVSYTLHQWSRYVGVAFEANTEERALLLYWSHAITDGHAELYSHLSIVCSALVILGGGKSVGSGGSSASSAALVGVDGKDGHSPDDVAAHTMVVGSRPSLDDAFVHIRFDVLGVETEIDPVTTAMRVGEENTVGNKEKMEEAVFIRMAPNTFLGFVSLPSLIEGLLFSTRGGSNAALGEGEKANVTAAIALSHCAAGRPFLSSAEKALYHRHEGSRNGQDVFAPNNFVPAAFSEGMLVTCFRFLFDHSSSSPSATSPSLSPLFGGGPFDPLSSYWLSYWYGIAALLMSQRRPAASSFAAAMAVLIVDRLVMLSSSEGGNAVGSPPSSSSMAASASSFPLASTSTSSSARRRGLLPLFAAIASSLNGLADAQGISQQLFTECSTISVKRVLAGDVVAPLGAIVNGNQNAQNTPPETGRASNNSKSAHSMPQYKAIAIALLDLLQYFVKEVLPSFEEKGAEQYFADMLLDAESSLSVASYYVAGGKVVRASPPPISFLLSPSTCKSLEPPQRTPITEFIDAQHDDLQSPTQGTRRHNGHQGDDIVYAIAVDAPTDTEDDYDDTPASSTIDHGAHHTSDEGGSVASPSSPPDRGDTVFISLAECDVDGVVAVFDAFNSDRKRGSASAAIDAFASPSPPITSFFDDAQRRSSGSLKDTASPAAGQQQVLTSLSKIGLNPYLLSVPGVGVVDNNINNSSSKGSAAFSVLGGVTPLAGMKTPSSTMRNTNPLSGGGGASGSAFLPVTPRSRLRVAASPSLMTGLLRAPSARAVRAERGSFNGDVSHNCSPSVAAGGGDASFAKFCEGSVFTDMDLSSFSNRSHVRDVARRAAGGVIVVDDVLMVSRTQRKDSGSIMAGGGEGGGGIGATDVMSPLYNAAASGLFTPSSFAFAGMSPSLRSYLPPSRALPTPVGNNNANANATTTMTSQPVVLANVEKDDASTMQRRLSYPVAQTSNTSLTSAKLTQPMAAENGAAVGGSGVAVDLDGSRRDNLTAALDKALEQEKEENDVRDEASALDADDSASRPTLNASSPRPFTQRRLPRREQSASETRRRLQEPLRMLCVVQKNRSKKSSMKEGKKTDHLFASKTAVAWPQVDVIPSTPIVVEGRNHPRPPLFVAPPTHPIIPPTSPLPSPSSPLPVESGLFSSTQSPKVMAASPTPTARGGALLSFSIAASPSSPRVNCAALDNSHSNNTATIPLPAATATTTATVTTATPRRQRINMYAMGSLRDAAINSGARAAPHVPFTASSSSAVASVPDTRTNVTKGDALSLPTSEEGHLHHATSPSLVIEGQTASAIVHIKERSKDLATTPTAAADRTTSAPPPPTIEDSAVNANSVALPCSTTPISAASASLPLAPPIKSVDAPQSEGWEGDEGEDDGVEMPDLVVVGKAIPTTASGERMDSQPSHDQPVATPPPTGEPHAEEKGECGSAVARPVSENIADDNGQPPTLSTTNERHEVCVGNNNAPEEAARTASGPSSPSPSPSASDDHSPPLSLRTTPPPPLTVRAPIPLTTTPPSRSDPPLQQQGAPDAAVLSTATDVESIGGSSSSLGRKNDRNQIHRRTATVAGASHAISAADEGVPSFSYKHFINDPNIQSAFSYGEGSASPLLATSERNNDDASMHEKESPHWFRPSLPRPSSESASVPHILLLNMDDEKNSTAAEGERREEGSSDARDGQTQAGGTAAAAKEPTLPPRRVVGDINGYIHSDEGDRIYVGGGGNIDKGLVMEANPSVASSAREGGNASLPPSSALIAVPKSDRPRTSRGFGSIDFAAVAAKQQAQQQMMADHDGHLSFDGHPHKPTLPPKRSETSHKDEEEGRQRPSGAETNGPAEAATNGVLADLVVTDVRGNDEPAQNGQGVDAPNESVPPPTCDTTPAIVGNNVESLTPSAPDAKQTHAEDTKGLTPASHAPLSTAGTETTEAVAGNAAVIDLTDGDGNTNHGDSHAAGPAEETSDTARLHIDDIATTETRAVDENMNGVAEGIIVGEEAHEQQHEQEEVEGAVGDVTASDENAFTYFGHDYDDEIDHAFADDDMLGAMHAVDDNAEHDHAPDPEAETSPLRTSYDAAVARDEDGDDGNSGEERSAEVPIEGEEVENEIEKEETVVGRNSLLPTALRIIFTFPPLTVTGSRDDGGREGSSSSSTQPNGAAATRSRPSPLMFETYFSPLPCLVDGSSLWSALGTLENVYEINRQFEAAEEMLLLTAATTPKISATNAAASPNPPRLSPHPPASPSPSSLQTARDISNRGALAKAMNAIETAEDVCAVLQTLMTKTSSSVSYAASSTALVSSGSHSCPPPRGEGSRRTTRHHIAANPFDAIVQPLTFSKALTALYRGERERFLLAKREQQRRAQRDERIRSMLRYARPATSPAPLDDGDDDKSTTETKKTNRRSPPKGRSPPAHLHHTPSSPAAASYTARLLEYLTDDAAADGLNEAAVDTTSIVDWEAITAGAFGEGQQEGRCVAATAPGDLAQITGGRGVAAFGGLYHRGQEDDGSKLKHANEQSCATGEDTELHMQHRQPPSFVLSFFSQLAVEHKLLAAASYDVVRAERLVGGGSNHPDTSTMAATLPSSSSLMMTAASRSRCVMLSSIPTAPLTEGLTARGPVSGHGRDALTGRCRGVAMAAMSLRMMRTFARVMARLSIPYSAFSPIADDAEALHNNTSTKQSRRGLVVEVCAAEIIDGLDELVAANALSGNADADEGKRALDDAAKRTLIGDAIDAALSESPMPSIPAVSSAITKAIAASLLGQEEEEGMELNAPTSSIKTTLTPAEEEQRACRREHVSRLVNAMTLAQYGVPVVFSVDEPSTIEGGVQQLPPDSADDDGVEEIKVLSLRDAIAAFAVAAIALQTRLRPDIMLYRPEDDEDKPAAPKAEASHDGDENLEGKSSPEGNKSNSGDDSHSNSLVSPCSPAPLKATPPPQEEVAEEKKLSLTVAPDPCSQTTDQSSGDGHGASSQPEPHTTTDVTIAESNDAPAALRTTPPPQMEETRRIHDEEEDEDEEEAQKAEDVNGDQAHKGIGGDAVGEEEAKEGMQTADGEAANHTEGEAPHAESTLHPSPPPPPPTPIRVRRKAPHTSALEAHLQMISFAILAAADGEGLPIGPVAHRLTTELVASIALLNDQRLLVEEIQRLEAVREGPTTGAEEEASDKSAEATASTLPTSDLGSSEISATLKRDANSPTLPLPNSQQGYSKQASAVSASRIDQAPEWAPERDIASYSPCPPPSRPQSSRHHHQSQHRGTSIVPSSVGGDVDDRDDANEGGADTSDGRRVRVPTRPLSGMPTRGGGGGAGLDSAGEMASLKDSSTDAGWLRGADAVEQESHCRTIVDAVTPLFWAAGTPPIRLPRSTVGFVHFHPRHTTTTTDTATLFGDASLTATAGMATNGSSACRAAGENHSSACVMPPRPPATTPSSVARARHSLQHSGVTEEEAALRQHGLTNISRAHSARTAEAQRRAVAKAAAAVSAPRSGRSVGPTKHNFSPPSTSSSSAFYYKGNGVVNSVSSLAAKRDANMQAALYAVAVAQQDALGLGGADGEEDVEGEASRLEALSRLLPHVSPHAYPYYATDNDAHSAVIADEGATDRELLLEDDEIASSGNTPAAEPPSQAQLTNANAIAGAASLGGPIIIPHPITDAHYNPTVDIATGNCFVGNDPLKPVRGGKQGRRQQRPKTDLTRGWNDSSEEGLKRSNGGSGDSQHPRDGLDNGDDVVYDGDGVYGAADGGFDNDSDAQKGGKVDEDLEDAYVSYYDFDVGDGDPTEDDGAGAAQQAALDPEL